MARALVLAGLGALGTAAGGLAGAWGLGASRGRGLGTVQAAAAGVMCALSFMELLPEAAAGGLEASRVLACFVCGGGLFFLLVWALPEPSVEALHPAGSEAGSSPRAQTKGRVHKQRGGSSRVDLGRRGELMASGVVTALGIALHNAPEGASVLIAGSKSPEVGLRLALAIALHNVPEGVAVAAPIYVATGSRWMAFKWAALSGLAEPLTAAVLAPFSVNLTASSLDALLAGVAGAMVALSIGELLPLAVREAGPRIAAAAAAAGVVVTATQLAHFH